MLIVKVYVVGVGYLTKNVTKVSNNVKDMISIRKENLGSTMEIITFPDELDPNSKIVEIMEEKNSTCLFCGSKKVKIELEKTYKMVEEESELPFKDSAFFIALSAFIGTIPGAVVVFNSEGKDEMANTSILLLIFGSLILGCAIYLFIECWVFPIIEGVKAKCRGYDLLELDNPDIDRDEASKFIEKKYSRLHCKCKKCNAEWYSDLFPLIGVNKAEENEIFKQIVNHNSNSETSYKPDTYEEEDE